MPRAIPSIRPFKRTSGYRRCTCPNCQCGRRQERGGNATSRPDTGSMTCYARALVSQEDKAFLIDEAKRQGLSISALVRRMILLYRSQHD